MELPVKQKIIKINNANGSYTCTLVRVLINEGTAIAKSLWMIHDQGKIQEQNVMSEWSRELFVELCETQQ